VIEASETKRDFAVGFFEAMVARMNEAQAAQSAGKGGDGGGGGGVPTAACALAEDLERRHCVLLQEFVHGAGFNAAALGHDPALAATGLSQPRRGTMAAGVALGRVFVCDLLLRNSDRLVDADLGWRGNLSNLMLRAEAEPPSTVIAAAAAAAAAASAEAAAGGDGTTAVATAPTAIGATVGAATSPAGASRCPSVVAIDTTLPRRPPRMALRADLTKLPGSLARALGGDEAKAKAKVRPVVDTVRHTIAASFFSAQVCNSRALKARSRSSVDVP